MIIGEDDDRRVRSALMANPNVRKLTPSGNEANAGARVKRLQSDTNARRDTSTVDIFLNGRVISRPLCQPVPFELLSGQARVLRRLNISRKAELWPHSKSVVCRRIPRLDS